MAGQLSQSAMVEIQRMMDTTTADPNKIPGCVAVVVDRDGKTLFQGASGKRGVDSKEPMTLDTVFWIASFTKTIGGIAAMQLAEQGKLALDDADFVEKLCPELKTVRILKGFDEHGKPELVDKKNRITLRMLLNNTAGFGYTFFNRNLRLYGQPAGMDEFDAHASGILGQPLLYEPGTDWSYGVGIDWAGTLIERVTSMTLNEYFETHIFAPLHLSHINMFPTPSMKHQLAHMHQKYTYPSDGQQKVRERDHLYRRPLIVTSAEVSHVYNSAGAGCFARPTDYAQILATLLNDGVSPTTQNRILKKESVDEMFTNQIPDFPNFGRKGIVTAKTTYTNDIRDFYPQPKEQPQGWGLTFMLTIHEAATGRGKNTAWWAGLPNLFWWCDREKGIAGLVATQILPFKDDDVLGLWVQIEKAVYDDLKSQKGVGQGLDGDHQE
ncbi:hypothetical protein MMC28_005163 [Mycoblastus sanguinarius]|nr:hypothetical protein [Mycoblastus sanguinarius]